MTSIDTGKLVLQVFGVLVGGGLLQFLIFLLKRRAEMRKLDVDSDVGLLGAAQAQIKTLMDQEAALRKVLVEQDTRARELDRRRLNEQEQHTRALEACEENGARLASELARARSEVATLRYQLDEADPRQQHRPAPPGYTQGRHRSHDDDTGGY